MRRDSIFYKLFQQSPTLLFELLEQRPHNAARYTFDSVAVKEPTFTIDGIFLPPEPSLQGTVYFCEVQFQKDELLYERLFGESMLYFYRNRHRFDDWQAVVIYPSRSKEQTHYHPYADLINGPRVHRIYLNELGNIQDVPIGLALMMLTTRSRRQAPAVAKQLLRRSRTSGSKAEIRAIMDIVTTIMVYKFSTLSRQEVEKMLGIEDSLQNTRFYQEAKAEGEYARSQSLVMRLLNKKIGNLNPKATEAIGQLDINQLDDLAIALLSFESTEDLNTWLKQHQ